MAAERAKDLSKTGRGTLKVDVRTTNALPVEGAEVIIADSDGQTLYSLTTDAGGQTEGVPLDAPDKSTSLKPGGQAYETYTVAVSKEGYIPQTILGAEVFDTIASTQPVRLHPKYGSGLEIIDVPDNALKQKPPQVEQEGPAETRRPRVLQNVIIPPRITVHMGTPNNTSAKNISVSFPDYIKNVTASEIYATWPPASIEANVHAIISLALNRIYTEWYRSRGYNFDITNSTQYDQYYKEGQTIPDNISRTVDAIFNRYIRRVGYKEPLFSSFCNGTTSTCPGMSQWGTVSLANSGYSPINILKYYYGDNIELTQTNNISDVLTSYPGYTLSQGAQGPAVAQMQAFLNRIATNFPAISKVTPDGRFGPATAAAVRAFQKSQNMAQTGVIDKATWNKISFIYVAVTKLAELTSEGQRVGIGASPPSSVIRQGARGKDVVELQFLLSAIAAYYDSIPPIISDGSFGAATTSAVKAFQQTFRLASDGIVGPATWKKLYEVYKSLHIGGDSGASGIPPYPGTPISTGSRGSDVELVQTVLNILATRYPSIPKVTVDGIYGRRSAAQVAAFQQLFGLRADGVVDSATWNAIMNAYYSDAPSTPAAPPSAPAPPPSPPAAPPYPGRLLRQGSRGENVRTLQSYLNKWANTDASIPKITADGVFGRATRAAVIAAQRVFGLTRDGIVGPATWNAVVR